ncbi:crosslink repair DNA glycosylase YcaQ family protein [Enterobacter cloacae complex sp. 2022EL-00981]|nr:MULTISPECIES: crosslink repair DNA glycosylase YcaQ family protein [Enterobacter cloacae complex]MCM7450430.1 winged helix DNA-binding domain-containing protein [Enterobacter cloacae]MDD7870040.1 crosslink repair DNA glycosylase YcaQ family protein [Enterobacter cloacae complex sp. 2022EL-00981]
MKPVSCPAAILPWFAIVCLPRKKWAGNTGRRGCTSMRLKLSSSLPISRKRGQYVPRILNIREKGQAAGGSGWWEWKPHKRHLEGLFTSGKVMVVERRNFQRVYDLTQRVMPHWDDERDLLTQEAAEAVMLENSARSLGIFRPQWLADYYRLRQPTLKPLLDNWQREQRVIPVSVERLGDMWLHVDLLPLLPQAEAGKLQATHSAVLSPFDPVVWDRKRAEQLFDFSYRLECYTPAPKRQYGYFVLPLLHKGQLVGRMDAKMHRKTGTLEVIALYLEEGVRITATLEKGLTSAINDFACWQKACEVTLGRVPDGLFTSCRSGWETGTP